MNALTRLLAVALLLLAGRAGADDGTTGAQAVVENLHQALMRAMTDADKLGYAGRFGLLAPVIEASFDFDTIARIVTGRHWKEISEEQREQFIRAFRQLSIATYASNFSGFSGERFEMLATEDSREAKIVKTLLVKADGDEVPLNYLLRSDNGQWRIINVIAQGVSDLSLKQADYTAVINSEGFDSLVDRLNKKFAEMSHGS